MINFTRSHQTGYLHLWRVWKTIGWAIVIHALSRWMRDSAQLTGTFVPSNSTSTDSIHPPPKQAKLDIFVNNRFDFGTWIQSMVSYVRSALFGAVLKFNKRITRASIKSFLHSFFTFLNIVVSFFDSFWSWNCHEASSTTSSATRYPTAGSSECWTVLRIS